MCMCRGLLTTGLGRMGFGAKRAAPQPYDYRNIIIFVVGGVSMGELRALSEQLQQAPPALSALSGGFNDKPRFWVGGTTLVGPADVCRGVFGW